MKISRSWYIVMIGGALIASAMVGCKRDRIERHRVTKPPPPEAVSEAAQPDTLRVDPRKARTPGGEQATNAGRLPAGHPDVNGMTPPEVEQMKEMAARMPGIAKPQAAGDAGIVFTLPAGWTEKSPPGPMLLHEFAAGDARATVSMLSGDGGGLLANVNRWRGQLGLAAMDREAFMKIVMPVKVDGIDGWRVDMAGQGDGAKATLGVIVERGGATWFFKMNGQTDAVKSQTETFDQFVQSVKWK
ncbi:MAG: hypothetical protein WC058_07995 [Phycisphaeraceae bacterium]